MLKESPLILKYAILTAVSTRPQAAQEKDSLTVQQETCRKTAAAKGWIETAGPFVIPGQPRTGYVNLSDAERDIPPLAAMLDSAAARQFQVLVIYDYTRLRDLISLVAASLADYHIQIYSLAQAIEPTPPDQFDPALTDAAWYNQLGANITSRAEINALRRRFKLGMPGRVTRKGLHPLGPLPYGYRKPPGRETDRQAIPEPDPATAPAVLLMRDLLLAGRSLPQIAAALDTAGYPTRTGHPWNPDTVRKILRNPYYAGTVTFGTLRRQRDSRTGRRTRLVRSTTPPHTGQGKHQPLYDQGTYRQITTELDRRGKSYPGRRSNRLTGLLHCSLCGSPLWVGYRSWNGHPATDATRIYYCSSKTPGHPRLPYLDLLETVCDEIVSTLQNPASIPPLPPPETELPLLQAEAAELEARRLRLRDAYLAGVISLEEYNQIQLEIKTRQTANHEKQAAASDISTRQTERTAALAELTALIQTLPHYLRTADPLAVNASLRRLLTRITVTPTGTLTLTWR